MAKKLLREKDTPKIEVQELDSPGGSRRGSIQPGSGPPSRRGSLVPPEDQPRRPSLLISDEVSSKLCFRDFILSFTLIYCVIGEILIFKLEVRFLNLRNGD